MGKYMLMFQFIDWPFHINDYTSTIYRFPFVCVSIGLTIGKVPTVGVVYNPILNEVRNLRVADTLVVHKIP